MPAGAYYAEAVRWAAANGVVKGVSSTEFGPSKNITRQELVTILWRLAAKKGLNTSNAGLTVPQTVEILYQINQSLGTNLPITALTDEECAQVLKNFLEA